jgi:hypothetical protein
MLDLSQPKSMPGNGASRIAKPGQARVRPQLRCTIGVMVILPQPLSRETQAKACAGSVFTSLPLKIDGQRRQVR